MGEAVHRRRRKLGERALKYRSSIPVGAHAVIALGVHLVELGIRAPICRGVGRSDDARKDCGFAVQPLLHALERRIGAAFGEQPLSKLDQLAM